MKYACPFLWRSNLIIKILLQLHIPRAAFRAALSYAKTAHQGQLTGFYLLRAHTWRVIKTEKEQVSFASLQHRH